MAEEMDEAEYRLLLDEANRQVAEDLRQVEEVKQRNFEAFLQEEEIPPFDEALRYMNFYDEMKRKRALEGKQITCAKTNRHAIACTTAIRREKEKAARVKQVKTLLAQGDTL